MIALRIRDRRTFIRELVQYVDYLDGRLSYVNPRFASSVDEHKMRELEKWLGKQMGHAGRMSNLPVWEMLADPRSVENLKREFPVKKSVQEGTSYNWVRIVIDKVAQKARQPAVRKAIQQAAVPHRGHPLTPGASDIRIERPGTPLAREHQKHTGTLVVRIGAASLRLPADVYEDPKKLVKWLTDRYRREKGIRDLVNSIVKEGSRWRGLPLAEAAQSAYYRAHVESGRASAAPMKDLKIPFGQFANIPIPDKVGKTRAARISELLSGRVGDRKTWGYLKVVDELRHERVPGTTKTYGEMYRTFYEQFDRAVRRRADLRYLWDEGFPDVDFDVSPRDAQYHFGRHEKARTRALLKHRLQKVPDPETLAVLYQEGVLTQGEFHALSGDISHVASSDFSRYRGGGFAPSDVQTNPWWFVHDYMTGLSRNVVGVNRYDRFAGGGRTPDGRRESERSHFYQQQTYPYSMVRKYQRHPKVYDPEYYESLAAGESERVLFGVSTAGRYAPGRGQPYQVPGTKRRTVREEAFFGKGFGQLPWFTKRVLRRAAEIKLERWERERLLAQKVEDAAKSILGERAGATGRGSPSTFYSGEHELDEGGAEHFTDWAEYVEAAERGPAEERQAARFRRMQEARLPKEEATFAQKVAASKSRDDLHQIAEDFQVRFGGFPRRELSPTFTALEDMWRAKWNVHALSESKRG